MTPKRTSLIVSCCLLYRRVHTYDASYLPVELIIY
jgi:hypothetical protein